MMKMDKFGDIDKCPFDIDTPPESDVIEKFKEQEITHPHFQDCYERAYRLAKRRGTSGVVILTGPTGVGKTRLCRFAVKSDPLCRINCTRN